MAEVLRGRGDLTQWSLALAPKAVCNANLHGEVPDWHKASGWWSMRYLGSPAVSISIRCAWPSSPVAAGVALWRVDRLRLKVLQMGDTSLLRRGGHLTGRLLPAKSVLAWPLACLLSLLAPVRTSSTRTFPCFEAVRTRTERKLDLAGLDRGKRQSDRVPIVAMLWLPQRAPCPVRPSFILTGC